MRPDNFNKDEGTKDSHVKQSTALPTNTPAPSEVRISTVKRSESIGTEHKLVKGLDQRADIDGKERWKMMNESEKTMAQWMVRRWNAIQKSPEGEKANNKLFVDFVSAKLKDIPDPTEAQIETICMNYVKDDILVHEAALFLEQIGSSLESAGYKTDIEEWGQAKHEISTSRDALEINFGPKGYSSRDIKGKGNVVERVRRFLQHPDRTDDDIFRIQYKGKRLPQKSDYSPLFLVNTDSTSSPINSKGHIVSQDLLNNLFGEQAVHKVSSLEDRMGEIVLARLDYYTSQGVKSDTLDPSLLDNEGELRINIANWFNNLNGLNPHERLEKLAQIVANEKQKAEKAAHESYKKKQEETDHLATKALIDALIQKGKVETTQERIKDYEDGKTREITSLQSDISTLEVVLQERQSAEEQGKQKADLEEKLTKYQLTLTIGGSSLPLFDTSPAISVLSLLQEAEKRVEEKRETAKNKEKDAKKAMDDAHSDEVSAQSAYQKYIRTHESTISGIESQINQTQTALKDYNFRLSELAGSNANANVNVIANTTSLIAAFQKQIPILEAKLANLQSNSVLKEKDRLRGAYSYAEQAKHNLERTQKHVTESDKFEISRAEDALKKITNAIENDAYAKDLIDRHAQLTKDLKALKAKESTNQSSLEALSKKHVTTLGSVSLVAFDSTKVRDFIQTLKGMKDKAEDEKSHPEALRNVHQLELFKEVFYPADTAQTPDKIMKLNMKKIKDGVLPSWDDKASFLKPEADYTQAGPTRAYIRFLQISFDKDGTTMTSEGKEGEEMRKKYMKLISEENFYSILGYKPPVNHTADMAYLNDLSEQDCMAIFIQLRETIRIQRSLEKPAYKIYPETNQILNKEVYDRWRKYAEGKFQKTTDELLSMTPDERNAFLADIKKRKASSQTLYDEVGGLETDVRIEYGKLFDAEENLSQNESAKRRIEGDILKLQSEERSINSTLTKTQGLPKLPVLWDKLRESLEKRLRSIDAEITSKRIVLSDIDRKGTELREKIVELRQKIEGLNKTLKEKHPDEVKKLHSILLQQSDLADSLVNLP